AQATITIEGFGGDIPAHGADLFVGNAGTAMRFLAGFLTLGRGRFTLDGTERMRLRPMRDMLDTMHALGVDARSAGGGPPIEILATGAESVGGTASIDASLSSQFVSGLLMPSALWHRGLELTV